jgi:hypothetical protein
MGRGKRLARMSAESRSTPPRSTANGSAPATPLQEMNYVSITSFRTGLEDPVAILANAKN